MQEFSEGKFAQMPESGQSAEMTHLWRRLMWLGLLFVVYGSLVPLDFHPIPWERAVERFANLFLTPSPRSSRVDLASNVLLSMPIAFAAGQSFLSGRSGATRWAIRAVIVLGVLLVAMSVEFFQQFFPPRTLSLTDIQAQTVGGVLALVLQWRWGSVAAQWLAGWSRRERASQRVVRMLKAYLLILLGFNMLPLDLTVSPVEIYHKWSEGRVLLWPFSGVKGDWAEVLYGLLSDVAVWIPVGALMGLGGHRTLWQVVCTGMVAALLIEFLQLFVYSRITDITDVFLAGVGACLGAWVAGRWWGRHQFGPASFPSPPEPLLTALGWAWLLVVFGVFWYPFSFQWPAEGAGWDWIRVPFATYQVSDEYRAANEVLRRLGFFLPGGLIWGLWAVVGQRGDFGLWWVLAVALLVEAGQIFQPGKVADLTDAGLAAMGVWIGWRLARWLFAPMLQDSDPKDPSSQPLCAEVPLRHELKRSEQDSSGLGGLVIWGGLAAGLTVLLAVFAQLPSVPYNVRELVAVGTGGLFSAAALVLCWLLLVALPLVHTTRPPVWVLGLPVLAAVSGGFAFFVLLQGVPLESIHDIVGAPVWDWPWVWELLWRFVGLWTAVFLVIALAALWVDMVLRPIRLAALIIGLLVLALLLYPLYSLIVVQAATDNLTELIAGHASLSAFVWLLLAVWSVGLAGSALSVWLTQPTHRGRIWPWLLAGAVLAPLSLVQGLEAAVIKYGRVFSALQFLLSSQRDAYVQGAALWLRLCLMLSLMMIVVAVLQYPHWRRYQTADVKLGNRE